MKTSDYLWLSLILVSIGVFSFLSLRFDTGQTVATLQQMLKAYDPTNTEHVIMLARLARVLVALFAGASLALSGLLMQLQYRNSLADPSLMGVTDGSALGVILVMAFFPKVSLGVKILASIVGSFFAYSLIRVGLKFTRQSANPTRLPLVGIVLSMILSSLTTLVASYFNLASALTSWYNSRLYRVELSNVLYFSVPVVAILSLLLLLKRQWHVYRFDQEMTLSIGMNRRWFERLLLFSVVVLTGITVAIVGRIAFVGLIIPHLCRLLFGNNYSRLLIMVPLMGASFVLGADYLSRWLNYPFETPIGIVFALVGVPLFLWLIASRREHGYEV